MIWIVHLDEYGSRFKYLESWLSKQKADQLFNSLQRYIPWQQEQMRLFGRNIIVPRRLAWFGDEQAVYTYSGITHQPKPWFDELTQLRQRLWDDFRFDSNSMLANLYEYGQHSMGWHSDDESSLGVNPIIASISLGQPRRFKMRHKQGHCQYTLTLAHGSVLIMSGPMQHFWQHCLPKTQKKVAPRINLTFRYVH